MVFLRRVALVIYVRERFERFGTRLSRRSRGCFGGALLHVCPGVLRWSFMCNTLISLCVQHDARIGTCFLGGGCVWLHTCIMLALEAFDISHTHKCHNADLIEIP